MDPLVSIIIPAYNSGPYLDQAIASVLSQTYGRIELIVVDDGSTDGTADRVMGYGSSVALIRQQRRGHPAARNTGIQGASGEFLAFLDHDDLWTPNKLKVQIDCCAQDPQLDLVFGQIQNFFSPELTEAERGGFRIPLMPLRGLLQGAMLARRSAFDRVGLFREDRQIGDFIDWFGRAMLEGLKMRALTETVMQRRIHRSNHQRLHQADVAPGYLIAVKELLDRRREHAEKLARLSSEASA